MQTTSNGTSNKMREWIDRVATTLGTAGSTNGRADTSAPTATRVALPPEAMLLGSEYQLLPMHSVQWAACALAYSAGEVHVFWGKMPIDLVTMIENGCLPEKLDAIRSASCVGGTEVLYEGDGFHLFVDSTRGSHSNFSVTSSNPGRALSVGLAIREAAPAPAEDSSSLSVVLWMMGSNGVDSRTRTMEAPSWADVSANYPTSTRSSIEWYMGLTPEDLAPNGSRLIVWHGVPGTGKTYALRALMRAWRKWCEPHIIIDPEQAFYKPHYLMEIVLDSESGARSGAQDPWKLIVVEDADLLLRGAESNSSKPALDRLLNLCDGLFGQGMRTLVLLTTNMRIAKLPTALVRPGRCLAITEFAKFPSSEARRWLGGDNGKGGTERGKSGGEKTLAELFEAHGDTKRFGELKEEAVGMYV